MMDQLIVCIIEVYCYCTAAGICAMVDLVIEGKLPQSGFVRQEQAPLKDFLANRFGAYYA